MRWRSAIAAAALLSGCHTRAGIRIDPPVTAQVAYAESRGKYDLYRVRLRAAGETATGRLLRPRQGKGPFPAVLLNDGRELNSTAVDYLPPDFGDLIVLSLDYPNSLPYEFDPLTLIVESDLVRRELRRIPRLFSLAAAYLTQRRDVDSLRVALVVTSFAVPFGVRAAAEDHRFRNVGLIYGAGDLRAVIEANLSLKPRFLRSFASWVAMQFYGEFEPTRYIAGIAPRPVVMVNGRDDPQMPVRAVRALYAAAREPKTLIWLTTGHLMPTDKPLIRALVDTTLARLPVLGRSLRGSRRCTYPRVCPNVPAGLGKEIGTSQTRASLPGKARAASLPPSRVPGFIRCKRTRRRPRCSSGIHALRPAPASATRSRGPLRGRARAGPGRHGDGVPGGRSQAQP